jgi:hypothetical protein
MGGRKEIERIIRHTQNSEQRPTQLLSFAMHPDLTDLFEESLHLANCAFFSLFVCIVMMMQ